MANYYSMGRTNYFAVKNLDLFKEEMDKISDVSRPIDVWENKDGENTISVALGFPEGLPDTYYNEDTDEDCELDWVQIIRTHLEDDWVCIIQEIGWEKLRYLTGYALAFNNKHGIDRTDLYEIYEAGEHLGKYCTQAMY
jgi:hypothetical protein